VGLPVAIDALFLKEKLGAGGTHQQQRLNIKAIFYGPSFKGPGMSEKKQPPKWARSASSEFLYENFC
jgi:hypothetical protein